MAAAASCGNETTNLGIPVENIPAPNSCTTWSPSPPSKLKAGTALTVRRTGEKNPLLPSATAAPSATVRDVGTLELAHPKLREAS